MPEITKETRKRVFYEYDGESFSIVQAGQSRLIGEYPMDRINKTLLTTAFASVVGQRFTQSVEGATEGTLDEIVEKFRDFLGAVIDRGSFSLADSPRTRTTKLYRAWLSEALGYNEVAACYMALRMVKSGGSWDQPLPRDFIEQIFTQFQKWGFIIKEGLRLSPNESRQMEFLQRGKVQDALWFIRENGVKVEEPDLIEAQVDAFD